VVFALILLHERSLSADPFASFSNVVLCVWTENLQVFLADVVIFFRYLTVPCTSLASNFGIIKMWKKKLQSSEIIGEISFRGLETKKIMKSFVIREQL
jgi:hypothetical protein